MRRRASPIDRRAWPSPSAPSQRGARSTGKLYWLMLLGAVVTLGTLAIGAAEIKQSRETALQQALQASDNLTIALARDVGRRIAVFDLSLRGAAAVLQLPELDAVSPEIRQAAVFDWSTRVEIEGSMVVCDAAGDITMGSALLPRDLPNVAALEHVRVQRERPDVGLFISRVIHNRLDNNDPIILLSRRIDGAHGAFAGVVIGGIRQAYFQDLFGKFNVGSKGSILLLRGDGRLLARAPFNPGDFDRDLSTSAASRRTTATASGRFLATASVDGVDRAYAFRRVGDLPLILLVGLSTDEVLAGWRQKATIIGLIAASLLAGSLSLGLLFRREMGRRLLAEQALASSIGTLSSLADTDGLTGIANRRAFDAAFATEWRRMSREAAPIALVMLDADCFKAYNDCYGHLDGDKVLISLAGCLRQSLWRPADIAARYGGEEFIALLPNTDASGACKIAERLHAAIRALDIPHALGPRGRVTVSVGVAAAFPRPGDDPAVLLRAVDAALYQAKQGGRDRTIVHAHAGACPLAV